MATFRLLDVPPTIRRPMTGLCKIEEHQIDYAVWHDKFIHLLYFNQRGISCDSISIESKVMSVFRSGSVVYCLEDSGTIYTLTHIRNEDEMDVFDSADEGEFSSIPTRKSFIPSINVMNVKNVIPVKYGFVLLKYNFEKLFIELYANASHGSGIKKSSCFEVCSVYNFPVDQCCLKVFNASRMSPELRQQLLKNSYVENIEIVFIGLPNGSVYYIAISSSNILSHPVLLYKCPYSVFSVVSIQNSQEEMFSKLGILLSYGIIILVSSGVSGSLCFQMTSLPCDPRVLLEIKNSFILGDGLNIWLCSFNESRFIIEAKEIAIKGVCFIEKYIEDGVLMSTVDNTFYLFSFKHETNMSENMKTQICHASQHEISQSLYRELQQIERMKQALSAEEMYISAISIFSRRIILKKYFSFNISVQKLSCVSIENYAMKYTNSDCGEVFKRNNSISNLFLIDTVIENKSDFEFSPLVWSLLSTVQTKENTYQKCEQLPRTFAVGGSLLSSMCVFIEQPYLGTSVSLSLVTKLPDHRSQSRGGPWLSVPLVTKDMNISYFIGNSQIKMKGNDNILRENKYFSSKKMNPDLSLFSDLVSLSDKELFYSYEFSTCEGLSIHSLWSLIQKLFACELSNEGNKVVSIKQNENKFNFYIGSVKTELNLIGQKIKVSSTNHLLLAAVKKCVLNEWMSHNSLQSIPVNANLITRVALIKEKLKIERMNKNKAECILLKNAWRNIVFEYLSV